jgi:hypothetical protein
MCGTPAKQQKGIEEGIRNKDNGEKHMRQPKTNWFRQVQEDIDR